MRYRGVSGLQRFEAYCAGRKPLRRIERFVPEETCNEIEWRLTQRCSVIPVRSGLPNCDPILVPARRTGATLRPANCGACPERAV